MAILGAYIVPHPPLIIPEVGRGNEKAIQSTIDSYNEVARKIASLKPDTIVVISPHTTIYADYFHISPGEGAVGSFARFGAPQVSFDEKYDKEGYDPLRKEAVLATRNRIHVEYELPIGDAYGDMVIGLLE